MSEDVRHFLVTKRHGRLERVVVFDDPQEAVRAYEQEERRLGLLDLIEYEHPATCVLLGADRLGTCIATHGNWFDEPGGMLGFQA